MHEKTFAAITLGLARHLANDAVTAFRMMDEMESQGVGYYDEGMVVIREFTHVLDAHATAIYAGMAALEKRNDLSVTDVQHLIIERVQETVVKLAMLNRYFERARQSEAKSVPRLRAEIYANTMLVNALLEHLTHATWYMPLFPEG